jgi:hypothetical protein
MSSGFMPFASRFKKISNLYHLHEQNQDVAVSAVATQFHRVLNMEPVMMPPINSPIDTLIAFAIVFATAVLFTSAILKYVERIKAAGRAPTARAA